MNFPQVNTHQRYRECSLPIKLSHGFTLIELMIGITIFAVGMTGIYALIQTSITSASRVKHEITITHLMDSSLELLRNNRDTVLRNYLPWDRARIDSTSTRIASWVYLVEDDFSSDHIDIASDGSISHSPVAISTIPTLATFLEDRFTQSRLSLDSLGRYTHGSGTGTTYATYVTISPITLPTTPPIMVEWADIIDGVTRPRAYRVTAHGIVSDPQYREYELSTILTDWQR